MAELSIPANVNQNKASQSHLTITFCQDTTIHGAIYLSASVGKTLKIFWLFIMVFSTIGLCIHLGVTVNKYFQYPSERFNSHSQAGIHFPDVTICYINGHNKLQSDHRYLDNYIIAQIRKPEYLYGQVVNVSGVDEEILTQLYSPRSLFANMDYTENMGFNLEDILIHCSHHTGHCPLNQFKYYKHPYYYNCYTYTGSETINTMITGPEYGLSLILYTASNNLHYNLKYEKSSKVANSEGMRITLQQHGSLPLPTDKGVDIALGYSTNIGLRAKLYKQLGQPYSKCLSKWEDVVNFENYGDLVTKYIYDKKSCFNACFQWHLVEKFGTQSSFTEWAIINPDGKVKYPYYNTINESQPEQVIENINAFNNFVMNTSGQVYYETWKCNSCFSQCKEFVYDTSSSVAVWPRTRIIFMFVKYLICDVQTPLGNTAIQNLKDKQIISNLSAINCLDDYNLECSDHFSKSECNKLTNWVRSNFMRVNIYFDEAVLN